MVSFLEQHVVEETFIVPAFRFTICDASQLFLASLGSELPFQPVPLVGLAEQTARASILASTTLEIGHWRQSWLSAGVTGMVVFNGGVIAEDRGIEPRTFRVPSGFKPDLPPWRCLPLRRAEVSIPRPLPRPHPLSKRGPHLANTLSRISKGCRRPRGPHQRPKLGPVSGCPTESRIPGHSDLPHGTGRHPGIDWSGDRWHSRRGSPL